MAGMPPRLTRTVLDGFGMNFAMQTRIEIAMAAMFVRILEYVAEQQPGSMPARRFIQKMATPLLWQSR